MLPLSKEGEHCCDYRVKIHKLESLPEMMGNEPVIKGGMWKIATNRERTIYRGLLGMEEEVGVILQLQDQGAEIQILSPDKNPRDPRDYVSLGHAMEAFCLQEKRMVLHSSCIIVNEKAILFSAPSGTGKSTHTMTIRRLFVLIGKMRFMPVGLLGVEVPRAIRTSRLPLRRLFCCAAAKKTVSPQLVVWMPMHGFWDTPEKCPSRRASRRHQAFVQN